MIGTMSYFSKLLEEHLAKVGYSAYRLAKETGLHEQHMYKITRGERRPTDDVIDKIASISSLSISGEELKAWRLFDEADVATINKAHEIAKRVFEIE